MHTPSMNGIVLRQRGWRERGQERGRAGGRGGGGSRMHALQERLCPATGSVAGAGAGAGAWGRGEGGDHACARAHHRRRGQGGAH